jgi:ABC-type multidrug transport system ATPase subunit
VKDIALQVRTGEIYGFLGPNGSGKTTFIRMLCGLLRADAGSGTCLGYDVITESDEIKRQVGYMTQKFSFWEDLSIAENLDFVARMYGVKNRRAIVDESIEQLGLSGRRKQLAGQLSGGWKAWIRRRGVIFGSRSTVLPGRGSPSSSPRTTWMKPSAATGSPTFPMASCLPTEP